MALCRLDEIGGLDVVTHVVPHEAQPAKGPLDQLTVGGGLRLDHVFARLEVMAIQRGVHDGDRGGRRESGVALLLWPPFRFRTAWSRSPSRISAAWLV